ncbi:MAG: PQQ-dependent sugar dehydrogenase [Thermoleophilia bacterium]
MYGNDSRVLVRVLPGLALCIFLPFFLAACGDVSETQPTMTASSIIPAAGTHTVAIDGHNLTLPDGFTVNRWMSGRGSLRMMALTDDGYLLVTEMSRGNVLAFRLVDEDPQAVVEVKGLKNPSGVAFHNGYIWVAEEKQVSKYRYEGEGRTGARETIIPDLPGGGHSTRTIGFGPDGRLYLTIGSSCNICEEDDSRRAAMSRYNIDGSSGEVIATGLRNTVGFTWHPVTGEIWGTDNGRDSIGDDLPPDEVNIILPGKNYGWPYCYGSFMVNPEYVEDREKARFCEATEPPAVELQAHSASLGLRFLTMPGWPPEWQRNLFVAFHGSWNRTIPTGYKVIRISEDKQVSDFITGWLDEKTGKSWGRPVDILFVDNKMYISDDTSGMIYRVSREQ